MLAVTSTSLMARNSTNTYKNFAGIVDFTRPKSQNSQSPSFLEQLIMNDIQYANAARPQQVPPRRWNYCARYHQDEHTVLIDQGTRERTNRWSKEAILKSLKTRTHRVSQEIELCTICHDGYEMEEKIESLSCGYEFHSDCIIDWLLVNNTCPICRNASFGVVNI